MTTLGEQLRCRRPGCGDTYSEHDEGGGPCQAGSEDRECGCPGFFWVDQDAEPVGSYREPPQRR